MKSDDVHTCSYHDVVDDNNDEREGGKREAISSVDAIGTAPDVIETTRLLGYLMFISAWILPLMMILLGTVVASTIWCQRLFFIDQKWNKVMQLKKNKLLSGNLIKVMRALIFFKINVIDIKLKFKCAPILIYYGYSIL